MSPASMSCDSVPIRSSERVMDPENSNQKAERTDNPKICRLTIENHRFAIPRGRVSRSPGTVVGWCNSSQSHNEWRRSKPRTLGISGGCERRRRWLPVKVKRLHAMTQTSGRLLLSQQSPTVRRMHLPLVRTALGIEPQRKEDRRE
jgi:hypothetical protein